MRTLLAAALLATLALTATAGQPDAKNERVARVQKELATQEKILATADKSIEHCRKNGLAGNARSWENAKTAAPANIAALKLELAWLKGELTLASAEAKVKAAQEAVDKAEKDDKPHAEEQKALAAAKAELEKVKAWEADAAKDF